MSQDNTLNLRKRWIESWSRWIIIIVLLKEQSGKVNNFSSVQTPFWFCMPIGRVIGIYNLKNNLWIVGLRSHIYIHTHITLLSIVNIHFQLYLLGILWNMFSFLESVWVVHRVWWGKEKVAEYKKCYKHLLCMWLTDSTDLTSESCFK